MYQMSEYDTVDIEMDVQGLHDVKEYHIHMVLSLESRVYANQIRVLIFLEEFSFPNYYRLGIR